MADHYLLPAIYYLLLPYCLYASDFIDLKMSKLSLYTAILFLLAVPAVFAEGSPANDVVRLETRPDSTMHPGTEGTLEFHFIPAEGIHINVDPPVAFSLDSVSYLTLNGKPSMTKDRNTGYLSTTDPVRQTVRLDKKAAPGMLTVKGIVTYFFCSETEGWCNKQREPVEFTIKVEPGPTPGE